MVNKPWEEYSEQESEDTQMSNDTPVQSNTGQMPWEEYSNGQEQQISQEVQQQPIQQESVQQPSQEIELRQMFSNTPSFVTDTLIAPMVEISRGLYRSTGSFYGKLDSISKLIEKGTGLKRGGIFEDWSKSLEQTAESLPDTGMNGIPQTIYEMVGGAVPMITEFAMTSKVPGLSGKEVLSSVGQFSLLEALDNYNQDPELKSLAKGAILGAEKGMSVMAGMKLAGQTIDLMYKGGKKVAEKYISFVTGDKKLGKEFVNNPNKFNISLKKNVKNSAEIKEMHSLQKETLSNKYKNEKMSFKDGVTREKELMDIKLRDAETTLRNASMEAKQSLVQRNSKTLDEVADNATKSIEKSQMTLQEKAITVYDNALTKYTIIKKEAGEKVGLAVDQILEREPLATINKGFVNNKVYKFIEKESPFIKVKDKFQTYKPRTSAGNQQDAKLFSNIMSEFEQRNMNNEMTIGYLQYLKKDLKNLSSKAYSAGNGELSTFYRDFSNKINPTQLAEDFVKTGNPNISNSLKELSLANKEYTSLMKRYDRAMDKYFTKNARGEYIPNPKKAFSAIEANDIASIREMKIADLALPQEDKIFPKIKKLVEESDKIQYEQKNIVKSLKNKARQEQQQLTNASKESLQRLQKVQRKLRTEEKNNIINKIREFNNKKDSEYNEIIKKLSEEEKFYAQQDALRKQFPDGQIAKRIQLLTSASSFFSFKGGQPLTGVGLLGATAALSPNIAAKTLKSSLEQQAAAKTVLKPLTESTILKQILGRGL